MIVTSTDDLDNEFKFDRIVELKALEVLPAIQFLGELIGPSRVFRGPDEPTSEAVKIVNAACRLPYSLRIVGQSLAQRPSLDLAIVYSRTKRMLLAPVAARPDRRDSLTLPYALMSPTDRRIFDAVGMLDKPQVATWELAALIGRDESLVVKSVDRIVHLGLLEKSDTASNPGTEFYVPELMRECARYRATSALSLRYKEEARARLLSATSDRSGYTPFSTVRRLAFTAYQRGDFEKAIDVAYSSLPLNPARLKESKFDGDVDSTALGLSALAEFYAEFGNVEDANDLAAMVLKTNVKSAHARALRTIGKVNRRMHRVNKALHALKRAERIADSLGDKRELARIAREQIVAYSLDDAMLAQARETLGAATKLMDTEVTGLFLNERIGLEWAEGLLCARERRYHEADVVLERAERNAETQDQLLWLAWIKHQRGAVARWRGDYYSSRQHFDRATGLFARMRHLYGQGQCSLLVGKAIFGAGRGPNPAISFVEEAVDAFRGCGSAWQEADALRTLGELKQACGDDSGQEAAFAAALAIFRRLGDSRSVARVLVHLQAATTQLAPAPIGARLHLAGIAETLGLGGKWSNSE
jgi:tetratricopeptide (TPR) repeat protein